MAVVSPLILDGDNNFIEMTSAQITAVRDRVRYLYGTNPSVQLSRVASAGSLASMSDTRRRSGPAKSDVAAYQDADAITTVTDTYDHINESTDNTDATADTNSRRFPVYYDANGDIRAMTLTDFRDTFIFPAIDTIVGSAGQPGTYYVHTATTLAGYTAVSTDIIYKDTKANLTSFTGAGIGTAGTYQDHPETVNNFYLLKANNISAPSHGIMCYIRTDDDIQQYSQSEIDTILLNEVRHCASEVTGSTIRFFIGGTGTTQGSGMTNTVRANTGAQTDYFVNTDDYRSQDFPNGTEAVETTYYLKCRKV
jgi:hypothetical protein